MDPALEARENLHKMNFLMGETQLHLAKVIEIFPQRGTIKVSYTDAGFGAGNDFEVPVCSYSLGTDSGHLYLQNITLSPFAFRDANGQNDTPIPTDGNDVWAIIGYVSGAARQPVCLGFIPIMPSQMVVTTPGLEVDRHESGVYMIRTPEGAQELHFPDGTFIRIGVGITPTDMKSENINWNITKQNTVNDIYLSQPNGLSIHIDSSKNITVSGVGTAAVNCNEFVVNSGTSHVALYEELAAAYNAHVHTGSNSGGGFTTSVPTAALPSDVASTTITST